MPRPSGMPTRVTRATTAAIGRRRNRPIPHPTAAPVRSLAASATASPARGAKVRRRTPSTSNDTVIASHTTNRPRNETPAPTSMLSTRCSSPRTIAPGSISGRSRVTRSPSTSAVDPRVTGPLKATTFRVTWPETSTRPLNATTSPRTVPSIVAGPSKMTTVPLLSPSLTVTRPVRTTCWSPVPRVPSCARAGVAAAKLTVSPATNAAVSRGRLREDRGSEAPSCRPGRLRGMGRSSRSGRFGARPPPPMLSTRRRSSESPWPGGPVSPPA